MHIFGLGNVCYFTVTFMGLQNYLQNLVHQFSDALQIQLKDFSYVMVMRYVIWGENTGTEYTWNKV